MPPAVAAAVIAAVGTTTASVVGAKMQSGAVTKSAALQTDATNRAADVQGKAAAEALAFQKQQAQADWRNSEISRRGNYDQWAASQRRLGSLGQMVGLGDREIPGYAPTLDPMLDPAAAGSAAMGAAGGQSAAGAQAYFDTLFPGETLTPDMLASKEADLGTKGIKLLRNAAGRPGKILLPDGTAVDVILGAGAGTNKKQWLLTGGASPTASPMRAAPQAGTLGSYALPRAQVMTPALTAPPAGGSLWDLIAMNGAR